MLLACLKLLVMAILSYLTIGYIISWKWLFEARIKCVDLKDKIWENYLNSVAGVFSFQLLCSMFWLPVIVSKYKAKSKVYFLNKNPIESKLIQIPIIWIKDSLETIRIRINCKRK